MKFDCSCYDNRPENAVECLDTLSGWFEDHYEDSEPIPSDLKKFSAEVKQLQSENAALRQKLEQVQGQYDNLRKDFDGRLKPAYDYVDGIAVSVAEDEIDRLQQRLARLVEVAKAVKTYLTTGKWDANCGHSPEYIIATAIADCEVKP